MMKSNLNTCRYRQNCNSSSSENTNQSIYSSNQKIRREKSHWFVIGQFFVTKSKTTSSHSSHATHTNWWSVIIPSYNICISLLVTGNKKWITFPIELIIFIITGKSARLCAWHDFGRWCEAYLPLFLHSIRCVPLLQLNSLS